MSKIRVQEIEHTASSNTNPAIALNANNNVTFDAGVTATSFTGSGANLTALPSANLTGALPAIDGSSLTGIADATKLPLTGGTLTGAVTFNDWATFNASIIEKIYTVTSAATITLTPGNGSIQTLTLGHSPTATLSIATGQSLLLLVTAGSSYTMTFTGGSPAIKWVGGSAPTLSTTDVTAIEFWAVGTQVYGATVGDLS